MKDLQNLVYKFMEAEQITLKQALLQSSLGMTSKSGSIAELTHGIVYKDYPYTEERKKRNMEQLGELLFYWVMLASTTGASPEEIMNQYIASYIQKNKLHKEDDLKLLAKALEQNDKNKAQASILEMLKYVKDNEPSLHLTTLKSKERVR